DRDRKRGRGRDELSDAFRTTPLRVLRGEFLSPLPCVLCVLCGEPLFLSASSAVNSSPLFPASSASSAVSSLLLLLLRVLRGFFFSTSSAVNSPHAQLVAEPYDRELFRARFDVDRHLEARPLAREVPRIDVLRVPLWLRRGPAAIGARDV